jgi:hypothetical protein
MLLKYSHKRVVINLKHSIYETRHIFQFLREEIGHDRHFFFSLLKLLSDPVSAYIAIIRRCKITN